MQQRELQEKGALSRLLLRAEKLNDLRSTGSWIHHTHPIETVQPNGYLAVNCTGFGCTIKCYFLITPEFYRIFLWKVLHMAINITDRFCMIMKFSKHENNSQLSYPDHSRYHNVNFHCNLQVFLICWVHYMKLGLIWEKFPYSCGFWQKSCCTTKYFFTNIYILTVLFCLFGCTVSIGWYAYICFSCRKSLRELCVV